MSKTIYELSNEVLDELEEMGHGKLTRDNFRYFWNGMARYFESKGVYEFDVNVAMEYFEFRCSKCDFKKRSENFIKRAILILDHYSKHGTIPLRCYTPISKLNNSKLIALLGSYGESLVAGEYSSRTIEGYLRRAGKFLQFAEEKKYRTPNDWSAEIIFEYISTLSKFQKATIKHRVGGLRLFLKYIYFNGVYKRKSICVCRYCKRNISSKNTINMD